MLSWMLYSIVVSLLMGLAALALERSAQIRSRPARWLWGACMAASFAVGTQGPRPAPLTGTPSWRRAGTLPGGTSFLHSANFSCRFSLWAAGS